MSDQERYFGNNPDENRFRVRSIVGRSVRSLDELRTVRPADMTSEEQAAVVDAACARFRRQLEDAAYGKAMFLPIEKLATKKGVANANGHRPSDSRDASVHTGRVEPAREVAQVDSDGWTTIRAYKKS